MLKIENTIISDDIYEVKFVCNLEHCLGKCCVIGDAGAPIEENEIEHLEENYDIYKQFMRPEGIKAVEEQGTFVLDVDGEYVTPLVNDAECAYVYFENNITKCAIEKAHAEGLIDFKKPISCHLYPVRLTQYDHFTAVNIHQWQVCSTAFEHGEALQVPVYKFLKEPLIRKFGERWYQELDKEIAKKSLQKKK